MPELPEVETTRRGIRPHIEQQTIDRVIVRESRLRWPVPAGLDRLLRGQRILSVGRRAKYLMLETSKGHLLIHLGMSGSLRLVPASSPAAKHDHVDIVFAHGQSLRLHDPRRFGAVLWCEGEPKDHPLLCKLGPEPLEEDFDGDYLYQALHRRKAAIKLCLMDNKVVVGVGNIYANEALFLAGIHPARSAARISRARIVQLAQTVREVLAAAITQGGTTLRDFVGGDGKPGYFAQQLHVYGRGGEDCDRCGHLIQQITQGQRSSWYCPHCQR